MLDVRDLTPHGFCLAWDPVLLWLHVVSDAIIAVSYYTIPLTLAFIVTRRRDLVFRWVFWLFAVFITACGTTHVMGIWTLWRPDYLADGLIKAVTAIASVGTAVVLWRAVPAMLALPSPETLRVANRRLADQLAERDTLLAALRRETSERERAEAMLRQSQKMEAVGQLTGGIAHDFNNLLMVIQGSLELLGARVTNDTHGRELVNRAVKATDRGSRLTQQLLAFGRRQALSPVRLDANALVRSLAPMLAGTLGGTIRLRTDLADAVWPLEADAHQLEGALLNLVINARDAMPNGGEVVIETASRVLAGRQSSFEQDIEPGDYVSIAVVDTGIGMTEDVKATAFEPFFTTKPIGRGSGLGLSQVYGFARQSRGYVLLDSAPQTGTRVTLLLPRMCSVLEAAERPVLPALSPNG